MPRSGVWRDPDFLKIWIGQAISQIGSRISRDGLPLAAIFTLGASPFQMGLLTSAAAASALVFGLFAGAWADRLRRRPILIVADLGRAVVLETIPLAAMFHRLSMTHLYLAAAASSILTVSFDVSYQAYLPSILDPKKLLEGNSKLVLTESVAEIAGPGLTGILVQWMTAPMAILIDAASFLVSAGSLWSIRKPDRQCAKTADPGGQNMGREIREGLAAVWSHPILRAVALRKATGSFFMGFIMALYMIFATRVLGLRPALLGTLISVGGVGSLFGAMATERLTRRFGFGRTFIGGAALTAFTGMVPAMAHGSVAVCATFIGAAQLFDVAWPIYSISELSLRQAITPDHLLGRVNSAMHLLFMGVSPVGALVAGAVANEIGMRTTMFVGAFGFLLSTLWLVFSPIRHLQTIPQSAAAAGR